MAYRESMIFTSFCNFLLIVFEKIDVLLANQSTQTGDFNLLVVQINEMEISNTGSSDNSKFMALFSAFVKNSMLRFRSISFETTIVPTIKLLHAFFSKSILIESSLDQGLIVGLGTLLDNAISNGV